jgi:thiol-disulfide isomerase/thioredoxin
MPRQLPVQVKKDRLPAALGLVLITLLMPLGCNRDVPSSSATSQVQSPQETDRIQLRSVKLAEWQKALAEYRGKYVVVDTWATWCLPCRQEFPHLVALHRKYADKGVVVMSVTIDDPKDAPKALSFLREQQADFPNFLLDFDEWTNQWNIKGIPIVLVFDREGKLLRRFDRDDPDRQFKYSDVDRFLAELVSK